MSGFDNTSFTVRSVTANTTLTNNDSVLLADPSGGAITVTLPLVSTVQPGRRYVVRSTGTTNAVTIARSGSDQIDGAGTSLTLASGAIHGRDLITDGTAWFTIDSF
jgi:hypothetical protein